MSDMTSIICPRCLGIMPWHFYSCDEAGRPTEARCCCGERVLVLPEPE